MTEIAFWLGTDTPRDEQYPEPTEVKDLDEGESWTIAWNKVSCDGPEIIEESSKLDAKSIIESAYDGFVELPAVTFGLLPLDDEEVTVNIGTHTTPNDEPEARIQSGEIMLNDDKGHPYWGELWTPVTIEVTNVESDIRTPIKQD